MATSTSPTDWFQSFYNHPNPAAPPPSAATLSGQPSDSTVVSTLATANTGGSADSFMGFSAATTATAANHVSGRAGNAGRVARPARRRPRASRKNPTTLLNTDTTNFRAMVQRYTGGGSMTYSAMDSAATTGFNIGGGYHHQHQHQGQMGNFNHLHHHGSMAAGVDLQASQLLHQQLMMQQQHGFGSTVDMSASSATGHVGPQGTDHLYPNSTSSMGGENKRDGFMF